MTLLCPRGTWKTALCTPLISATFCFRGYPPTQGMGQVGVCLGQPGAWLVLHGSGGYSVGLLPPCPTCRPTAPGSDCRGAGQHLAELWSPSSLCSCWAGAAQSCVGWGYLPWLPGPREGGEGQSGLQRDGGPWKGTSQV